MTTIKNVEMQFSDSGKICKILADNGRIIAELLCHGPMVKCAINADRNNEVISGRANIYRGEVHGLTAYEFLDVENETIEER